MTVQLGEVLTRKNSGTQLKRNIQQGTKALESSGMKRNVWLDCKNGNRKTKVLNELSWWIIMQVTIGNIAIFRIGLITRQRTDGLWKVYIWYDIVRY